MSKKHPSVRKKVIQVLRHKLKLFLTDAKRIVLLTIGNEMRRDDGIGIAVFKELKGDEALPSSILLLNSGTTPENFTRSIERWNPSHLLIIDAVDMGKKPGELELIHMDDIPSITVSTHKMSLSLLNKYLTSKLKLKIKLLGVQIKDISFGEGLSPELEHTPLMVAELINTVLKEITR